MQCALNAKSMPGCAPNQRHNRLFCKGKLVVKFRDGHFGRSITEVDHKAGNFHQIRWPCSAPSASTSLLGTALGNALAPPVPSFGNALASIAPGWIAVRQRFEQLHRNIRLTPLQELDGYKTRASVVIILYITSAAS